MLKKTHKLNHINIMIKNMINSHLKFRIHIVIFYIIRYEIEMLYNKKIKLKSNTQLLYTQKIL